MKLQGSLPVIPTPFYNGRIDYDSLLRLFDHLFPELDGYTLGGSTGESVSLSLEERRELMKFAVENTPSGKTIVAGLTHTNLQDVIALARHRERAWHQGGVASLPLLFSKLLRHGSGILQGA